MKTLTARIFIILPLVALSRGLPFAVPRRDLTQTVNLTFYGDQAPYRMSFPANGYTFATSTMCSLFSQPPTPLVTFLEPPKTTKGFPLCRKTCPDRQLQITACPLPSSTAPATTLSHSASSRQTSRLSSSATSPKTAPSKSWSAHRSRSAACTAKAPAFHNMVCSARPCRSFSPLPLSFDLSAFPFTACCFAEATKPWLFLLT